MNVAGWSDRQQTRWPDYETLIFGPHSWNSRTLFDHARRLAGGLLEMGLKPGQRVVLTGPNSDHLVAAFEAVLRAGGVAVLSGDEEPERLARETEASFVLSPARLCLGPPLEEPVERGDDDLAQIVYTSGTTGSARGVAWSHGTVQARYLDFADRRAPGAPERRSLCVLPLAAAFGTQYLYLRWLQKMQLVLLERFHPTEVLATLQKQRIQATMLVPTMVEGLLQTPGEYDLKHLKSLWVGGAPVSLELAAHFQARFGVGITTVYGLTELGPVARARPGENLQPSAGLQWRLNARGEVEVRAGRRRAVLYGQPAPADEWLATGDLGRLDSEGGLELLGRADERILQGGANLYPQPIEAVIKQIPGVLDCAVVGEDDPYLGQAAVAWVVSLLAPEQILAGCRSLPPRGRPARVRYCDEIPRNVLGKVQRHALKARALPPGRDHLLNQILKTVAALTGGTARADQGFADQGLDSLGMVQLAHGLEVSPPLLFEHSTPARLARYLEGGAARRNDDQRAVQSPVAIVGWACRLPGGVDSPEELWRRLLERADLTAPLTRWALGTPQRAALLEESGFDADFFGLSPREAARLDGQHRLVLETCWRALEDAGYAPASGLDCGLFLGISAAPASRADPIGALPSMAAGRVAHLLDLRGPALALDTSCSSALVAVHQAVQSLCLGECAMALAGGVNLIQDRRSFTALQRLGALAADGRCKSFDAGADGFGRGEGCLFFVLKRLDHAGQDSVRAVIRGSALNHDGRSSSLTAPNSAAQAAVARAALRRAGLAPSDIDYLEAHGSGTPLGDPAELTAAMQVYPRLVVGSVKSNLGHLEAAAGAAGLLKAALVVQHHRIPPQGYFQLLHAGLSQWAERITVPTEVVEGARRAAVMSTGMSGTNAYVVVEEPPPSEPVDSGPALICLSAREPEALEKLTEDILRCGQPPADVAYTCALGRQHFQHRRVLLEGRSISGQAHSRPRLAFLFTGQGALYAGAGRELFECQPIFRRALQRCEELRPGLLETLWQGPSDQSALFALEWSLAQLWLAWGLRPQALLGHSLGEYAAACVAGLFSLEQGLALVAERQRLTDSVTGAMLAVQAEEAAVTAALGEDAVWLAARNGPRAVVLAGERAALLRVRSRLTAPSRFLEVNSPYHCPLLERVAEPFGRALAAVDFGVPSLPLISTAGEGDFADPQHWLQGLTRPVEFDAAIQRLAEEGATAVLEIGPHPVLCGLTAHLPLTRAASLRRGEPEQRQLLEALGILYTHGLNPDWKEIVKGRRVPLPTYPFQQRTTRPAPQSGDRLTEIVSACLGHRPDPEANLLESGLDSLRALQLAADLERHWGVACTPADLATHSSLNRLRRWLELPEPAEVLVRLRAGRGPALICLHGAGGQIGPYLRLSKGRGYPVYAVQSPALHAPERERASLGGMAFDYTALIQSRLPRGALALLGWSMGAWLAQAVASRLEEAGRKVLCVLMLDPPGLSARPDPWLPLVSLLHDYHPDPPGLEELRRHPADPEEWRRLGWLPENVGPRRCQDHLCLYQHHLELLSAFQPQPIAAPIHFGWAQPPARPEIWSELTRGQTTHQTLGGDHFSVLAQLQRWVERNLK